MIIEEATYQLTYENEVDQPVISLHTHRSNLEALADFTDNLTAYQTRLGLRRPFSFDETSFGYDGSAKIEDSSQASGWAALKLYVPEFVPNTSNCASSYYSRSAQLLPVVSTAAVTLSYLKEGIDDSLKDANEPQYVRASLSNDPGFQSYGARISGHLSPMMLDWLASNSAVEESEARVRSAITQSYTHADGRHDWSDKFRVNLKDPLKVVFDYPGDGSGFFAPNRRSPMTDGLKLIAANNDYPVQQIAILAGLAALNGLALQS